MTGYRPQDEYGPSTYGDRIADVYDEFYGEGPQRWESIELLAELAGDGPVLELGIGTGRIALPLAERGVEIHGIDASEEMVARLREKPGGDAIPVAMGDMADVDGPADAYSMVFVAFNTFYALLTQEDQVRCFSNIATRLPPGGRFVMSGFVPDLQRFGPHGSVTVTRIEVDEVRTDYSLLDPVKQLVKSSHVVTRDGEPPTIYPVRLRYCWPSELDLMGRLAGLELEDRWADWERAPFTSQSGMHVSVWRKSE